MQPRGRAAHPSSGSQRDDATNSRNSSSPRHSGATRSPMSPTSPPTGLVTSGTNVIAQRFKTRMCRNFVQTGVCPYEAQCMFAHGDDELRTEEMNIRDCILTDNAIKVFQRRIRAAKQRALRAVVATSTSSASPQPASSGGVHTPGATGAAEALGTDENGAPTTATDDSLVDPIAASDGATMEGSPRTVQNPDAPRGAPAALGPSSPTRHQHNPYAGSSYYTELGPSDPPSK